MKCYAKDYCKGFNSKCNEYCDLKLKLDAIYELSEIPKRYIYDIPLTPEKVDLSSFKFMADWKEQVVDKVSDGESLYIWSSATGTGKAQPLTSKVMTLEGYKLMGDLCMTDKIIGDDGKPHTLLGIFPQGKKDVYEITFSDGSKTQSCAEHLWTYQTRSDRAKGVYRTTQLSEILKQPLWKRGGKSKAWQFYIPMTAPIQFETEDLPIHPYVLGVLLGDGGLTETSIMLTNAEPDILGRVQELLPQDIRLRYATGTTYRLISTKCTNVGGVYGGNLLIKCIRELGLKGTNSYTKFVPAQYKLSSVDQRLQLLQGLVDTDGYVMSPGGAVEYSTSSPQLAEDVKFLVQSLGGTCVTNTRMPRYTYKGESRVGGVSYRLNIKLPNGLVPFSSKKHLSKYTGKRQREPYRNIVDIRPIGSVECQCIMVDSDSHLYLTDDMIVTHNTAWSTKIANYYIRKTVVSSELKRDVIYISCSQFLENLRKQYDDKDGDMEILIQAVMSCKLLIIDDIGAERPTDWARERLYDIINHRYINMKSTIFTSNFSPNQLEQRVGSRIASRIKSYDVVELKGIDRRVK